MRKMILYMASRNLMRRLRFLITVVLCVVLTSFSFVLTVSVLTTTVSGISLSRERQGADVLVYPNVPEINDASMLYSGVAQSVYMDASLTEQLDNGMAEDVAVQFYLHTLPSGGCCETSEEYRLVGIDWDTDFIVKPWVENPEVKALEKGQILVGSALKEKVSGTTIILNNMLNVVSVLEPTGTSLDHSLILNIDQLRQMGRTNFLPSTFGGRETKNVVTCVMIRLKDGISADEYISGLSDVNAKFISVSSAEKRLKQTVDTFSVIFTAVVAVIAFLCCVTLMSQFRLLTISRCKEVGYLRSIGMSRLNINVLFILEFGVIGLAGGLMGSVLGIMSARPVIDWLSRQMSFPTAGWSGLFVAKQMAAGIIVSLFICMLSTIAPLRYITHISPHEAITKGEV